MLAVDRHPQPAVGGDGEGVRLGARLQIPHRPGGREPDDDGDGSTGGRPAVVPDTRSGSGRAPRAGWLRSTAPNATPPPRSTVSATAAAATMRQGRSAVPMSAVMSAVTSGSAATPTP